VRVSDSTNMEPKSLTHFRTTNFSNTFRTY
jgi:hypothetical protein